jgi:Diguanylate cyclase, GGDEF domain
LSLGITQDVGSNAFDERNQGTARIEQAWLGWHGAFNDGWRAELSAGSQDFMLGTGMLIYAGAINGAEWGNAASYKRSAWRVAGVGGLGHGDFQARAFWLDPNEVPSLNSGTRIAGAAFDWANARDGKAGLATLWVPESNYAYPSSAAPFAFILDGRKGLRVLHGWSELTGFFGTVHGRAVVPGDRSQGTIWGITDTTQAHLQREQPSWPASHDRLTGHSNRAAFAAPLEEVALHAATRSFCALVIDLDRFEQVNDSGGHAAGDLPRRGIAPTKSAALRSGDTVARLGRAESSFCCRAAVRYRPGRGRKAARRCGGLPTEMAGPGPPGGREHRDGAGEPCPCRHRRRAGRCRCSLLPGQAAGAQPRDAGLRTGHALKPGAAIAMWRTLRCGRLGRRSLRPSCR